MSALSVLESYDLLRFAEQLRSRIATVQEEHAAKKHLGSREHRWLAEALDVLDAPLAELGWVLEAARALPELEDLAHEVAFERQNKWVDALEKLLAGITFHAGSRSPLIEALYPHQKLATLRRASREIAGLFASDFDRRLKSGYVTRMLGQEDFAFIHPTVERVKQAYAEWQQGKTGPQVGEEELKVAREGLVALASRAELAVRQAKLIAEAALTPVPNAFEDAGLNAKPRKRSGRAAEKAVEAPPAPEVASPDATGGDDETGVPGKDDPAPSAATSLAGESDASAPSEDAAAPAAPPEKPRVPAKGRRKGAASTAAAPSSGDAASGTSDPGTGGAESAAASPDSQKDGTAGAASPDAADSAEKPSRSKRKSKSAQSEA